MGRFTTACICIFACLSASGTPASAKKIPPKTFPNHRPTAYVPSTPTDLSDLPLEYQQRRPSLTQSAVDTFHLAWFGFEGGGGPDPQGWTSHDITEQEGTFFHVADATELDGGTHGTLVPLEGAQSMWCGVAPDTGPLFCGYATLPGYGNGWDQSLTSKTFACDSVRLYYRVKWDSEENFDGTTVEYWDPVGETWMALPVNGGAGVYDGTGLLDECLALGVPAGSTKLRFHFTSDGNTSDYWGGWPSDGAVTVDSITVECFNGGVLTDSFFEDFEDEAPGAQTTDDGCWTATIPPGFGDFAALYSGLDLAQGDPCLMNTSHAWAFIDDRTNANYACGGLPNQGVVPYGNADGLYINNEIWSPPVPFTGSGNGVRVGFLTYFDNPMNTLVGFAVRFRVWVNDCPQPWENLEAFYFGDYKRWLPEDFVVGDRIEPGTTHVQLALAVIDWCGSFCGVWGDGSCHSHAPLFDDVYFTRINVVGPRWDSYSNLRFHDKFSEDGTLTGHVRADNGRSTRSDSATVIVTDPDGLAAEGPDSLGSAVYAYVAVRPPNQPGKSGPALESPELAPIGKRFPLVDSIAHDGVTWYQFRVDSTRKADGTVWFSLRDNFCFDLNDWVFTPGDTVCYVFGAENVLGEKTYLSREFNGQGAHFMTDDLWEALASPMEFTCLPAGGWRNGGDILYIDSDRIVGELANPFFDAAFAMLGLSDKHDRYDLDGATLSAGVKNINQIISCYRKIIWSVANNYGGAIPDQDFGVLFDFLDQHPDDPGLYVGGNDVATTWDGSNNGDAINLRSTYMNFGIFAEGHHDAGEPLSPLLEGVGPCFIDSIDGPQTYILYGSCPPFRGFDLLQPGALSTAGFQNPSSNKIYSLTQATANTAGSTARVMLAGHAFPDIRDAEPGQNARAEYLRSVLRWLGNSVPSPVGIGSQPRATNFLANACPNPFNPTTTIRYGIKNRGHVSIRVYTVAGALVRTLVDEVQTPRPGGFAVEWDGSSATGGRVASGVYFCKLTTPSFQQTRKIVLLK